jgi:hypothetical protein
MTMIAAAAAAAACAILGIGSANAGPLAGGLRAEGNCPPGQDQYQYTLDGQTYCPIPAKWIFPAAPVWQPDNTQPVDPSQPIPGQGPIGQSDDN